MTWAIPLAVIATLSLSSATASASRYCGTINEPNGPKVAVTILEGSTSCTSAKRVLRAYDRSIQRSRCRTNACPRAVRGYRCSASQASEFPRLYTCATARNRIAAYSTAE